MGLVQKASSELEFAKTKKDVLRKSLEHIQAQSVSILSLTLDWKDLEAHLDSVQQSILQRAEEVEWREKRLVERSEIAGLREKELESAQNSFHDRVRQIELKEEGVDKFQKSVEKLFQEVEIARKLVEDCSKEVGRKEKEVADRLHEIESKEKEIEGRQRAVELKEGNVENLQNSVEEPSKQVELKVKESKNSVQNSIEKSSKEPEPKKKRKVLVRTTTKGGEKKQQTIQDCWKEVEQREKEVAQRFKEIELKEKEVEQRQKAAELKEADIESLQKSVEERSKQVEKRFKLIKKFENLVQSRKKLTITSASTPDSNAQPKKGLVRPPILRPPDSGTQLVEPSLCEVCNIKCFYQHEVDTHLAGKKHQSWLDNFSPYQAIPGLMTLEPLSLTFPNAPPAPSIPQQDDKLPCTLPQAEASLPLVLGSLQSIASPVLTKEASYSSPPKSSNESLLTRRRSLVLAPCFLGAFLNSTSHTLYSAFAQEQDEFQQDEDRVVHLFQETSPSVVYIKDVQIVKNPKSSSDETMRNEDENAKVEGTGSGFIWDKFGHIVTNYHVVAKLATDKSGLQRCKVYLVDARGNSFSRDGKIIGFDEAYDLAVLKIDVQGNELKPVVLGKSGDLRVGQSCFAIGNPYGYENTLTTGVVSGLGREIPSPNGRAIRGAIQTDASINSGNSGGPLIDSYGHVIGVNTATFTRKGTGVSSGVNFAIPTETVVQTVPYLIVYGTPYSDRF